MAVERMHEVERYLCQPNSLDFASLVLNHTIEQIVDEYLFRIKRSKYVRQRVRSDLLESDFMGLSVVKRCVFGKAANDEIVAFELLDCFVRLKTCDEALDVGFSSIVSMKRQNKDENLHVNVVFLLLVSKVITHASKQLLC